MGGEDAGAARGGDFGVDEGVGVGVADLDDVADSAGFCGDGLGGELDPGGVEGEKEGGAFGDDDGAAEVGELDGLTGLEGAAEGLAFGLRGGSDEVAAGEADAQAGPLEVGGGDDVAGVHGAGGDRELGHLLDAAGEADLDGGCALCGGGDEGGEAAGGGAEVEVGDVDGGLGVGGEEGGR